MRKSFRKKHLIIRHKQGIQFAGIKNGVKWWDVAFVTIHNLKT